MGSDQGNIASDVLGVVRDFQQQATGLALAIRPGVYIEEAKQLPEPPKPEISRMQFDMKDQNIRLTIQNTADDVAEI